MQNIENLDVFEILITQKLLKCPKDPFVRSALKCMFNGHCTIEHEERKFIQAKKNRKMVQILLLKINFFFFSKAIAC